MLDAGITKLNAQLLAEAEMLGMIKAPDVLLAYQPTTVKKAKRLLQLIQKYPTTHFSCLIDDAKRRKNIAAIFSAANNFQLMHILT